MKVVTVVSNTEHPVYIKYLKASCDYYNIDLVLLKYQKEWTGNRIKDSVLKSYLEKLYSNETIMCIDAYDTLFLRGTKEIKERFRKFKIPILYAAEQNCWPVPALDSYYKSSGNCKYLNGGGFIGESKSILELMNRYDEPPVESFANIKDIQIDGMKMNTYYQWSNQYYWSLIYLKHQDVISLDHNCEIFFSLGTPLHIFRAHYDDFQKEGFNAAIYQSELNRVRAELIRINSLKVEQRPLHLHFNGPVVQAILKNEDLSEFFEWL